MDGMSMHRIASIPWALVRNREHGMGAVVCTIASVAWHGNRERGMAWALLDWDIGLGEAL
jgi:sugar phosphate permease